MPSVYYVDFGVLKLYNWFATKTHVWHETGPIKSPRADVWCTRFQMVLRIFLVSMTNLAFEKVGSRLVAL